MKVLGTLPAVTRSCSVSAELEHRTVWKRSHPVGVFHVLIQLGQNSFVLKCQIFTEIALFALAVSINNRFRNSHNQLQSYSNRREREGKKTKTIKPSLL